MKVLILSHNTGGGHNSVAKALKEEFGKNNIECNLAYANISVKKVEINKTKQSSYDTLVRIVPKMYKYIFILGELYSKSKIKSPLYGYNKMYAKNLLSFVEENKYDVVIVTHLFPGETITFLNQKNKNIHFIAISTDYVCMPLLQEIKPDYYVVPSKDLINSFVKKGINKKEILPFGIPVLSKFKKRQNKVDSREKLKLPINKKIALIMTGSMGFGKMNLIIDEILKEYGRKVLPIVMCGNNEKLKNNLEKKYKKSVIALGYKNNVDEYMDASDVLITKPGGITSTESAVKNIPTIFTDPIPGVEIYNAKFFEERGMAYYAENYHDVIKYLDIIFNNIKAVNNMKKKQSKYINKNSSLDLVNFIVKKYNKNSN